MKEIYFYALMIFLDGIEPTAIATKASSLNGCHYIVNNMRYDLEFSKEPTQIELHCIESDIPLATGIELPLKQLLVNPKSE